jgi:hypothetical protein
VGARSPSRRAADSGRAARARRRRGREQRDPLNELASVRSLFFANPGYTLGGRKKQVLLQAQVFDSAYPEVDQPLADPASATGKIHGTQAVPNLMRITVQGSTNTPSEWLRLTIDPRSPQIFSWHNVVYLP